MKKVLFGLLSLLCFCVTINVNYGAFKQSGNYQYEVFLGEAKIVSYDGTAPINNIVIPSKIDGYYVTSIGYQAFKGCTNLTGNLTIPNTVKSIGYSAFEGCTGLNGTLAIPTSVTSIGGGAFKGCSALTGNLTIPNSVKIIEEYAFASCSGFNGNLTISNNATYIGENAFEDCRNLKGNLVIPNSVSVLGDYAFNGCTGFNGTLTISNSITSIGSYTFYNCVNLTGNLTIPTNLMDIGDFAFYGCSKLTGDLTIPTTVISIGDSAFAGCTSLTGTLILSDTVKSVGDYAFPTGVICSSIVKNSNSDYSYNIINNKYVTLLEYLGNGQVANIVIPTKIDTYDVTGLGKEIFYNYTDLTGNLTIPDSVIVIGNNAFNGCEGFTGTITLPSNVVIIGDGSFNACKNLSGNLTIPSSVNKLGDFSFSSCENLTGSLTIPTSVIDLGDYCFTACGKLSGNIVIPNGITRVGNGLFLFCTGFAGNVTIPTSVTSIGSGAFTFCNNLTGNLTLPSSVTDIGDIAFNGCSALTGTTTINNLNISIGARVFEDCDNLKYKAVYPMDIVAHWSQDIIVKWINRGMTAGHSATNLYYPDQYILKADLMYTINRLMKYTDKVANISSIQDVRGTDWYYADVQKAIKAGYVYPMTGNNVYPSSTVNREQFMVMMSRALKLPTANLNVLDKFADKDSITASIKQEVANYVGAFGFSGNTVNGKLCLIPQNILTKADAFYFIDKAFNTYDNPPVVNNVANDTINHWSKDIIESLIDRGITSSHNITKCFYPNDYILKADLIYTINRMMKFIELSTGTEMSKYTDVNSSNWFYADMQKAVKAGYIYPLGENSISPYSTVTREQLFVMLARALKLPNADISILNRYADKDQIPESIRQEVANYLTVYDFMGNVVKGNFCLLPQNKLTKADLMYFVYKAIPQEKITVLNQDKQLSVGDTINFEVMLSQSTIINNTYPKLSIKIGTGSEVQLNATSLVGRKLTYSYVIPSGVSGYVSYKLVEGDLKGLGNVDYIYSKYYQCDLYKVTL